MIGGEKGSYTGYFFLFSSVTNIDREGDEEKWTREEDRNRWTGRGHKYSGQILDSFEAENSGEKVKHKGK